MFLDGFQSPVEPSQEHELTAVLIYGLAAQWTPNIAAPTKPPLAQSSRGPLARVASTKYLVPAATQMQPKVKVLARSRCFFVLQVQLLLRLAAR
jgi:hypothetical protein